MTADVVDFLGVLTTATGSIFVRLVHDDFHPAPFAMALFSAFFLATSETRVQQKSGYLI
jgi:hypothetical protein